MDLFFSIDECCLGEQQNKVTNSLTHDLLLEADNHMCTRYPCLKVVCKSQMVGARFNLTLCVCGAFGWQMSKVFHSIDTKEPKVLRLVLNISTSHTIFLKSFQNSFTKMLSLHTNRLQLHHSLRSYCTLPQKVTVGEILCCCRASKQKRS